MNEIPQEKHIPGHGIMTLAIGYSSRRSRIWRTEVCIYFTLSNDAHYSESSEDSNVMSDPNCKIFSSAKGYRSVRLG